MLAAYAAALSAEDPLSGLERRQQIREALADARPGLGDEVPAAGERHLDRVGERRLLGARLELGQGAGEAAAGTELFVHRRQAYATERMFPFRPPGGKSRSLRTSTGGGLDGLARPRIGCLRRIR